MILMLVHTLFKRQLPITHLGIVMAMPNYRNHSQFPYLALLGWGNTMQNTFGPPPILLCATDLRMYGSVHKFEHFKCGGIYFLLDTNSTHRQESLKFAFSKYFKHAFLIATFGGGRVIFHSHLTCHSSLLKTENNTFKFLKCSWNLYLTICGLLSSMELRFVEKVLSKRNSQVLSIEYEICNPSTTCITLLGSSK